jgi:hypothetical protein
MSLWRGTTYADLIGHISRTNLEHFELRNQCTSDGTWLSCDATVCNLVVKLLGRNPRLKRFILLDSEEMMFSIGWPSTMTMAILDAALSHPTLRDIEIECSDDENAIPGIIGFWSEMAIAIQPDMLLAVAKLIRTNRKIRDICISGFDCNDTLSKIPEMSDIYQAMRSNYLIRQIPVRCHCKFHVWTGEKTPLVFEKIRDRVVINIANSWQVAHRITSTVALALRSLKLSPYAVLWILDWVPGCNYIYDDEFDPHRLRKLALIEHIARDR